MNRLEKLRYFDKTNQQIRNLIDIQDWFIYKLNNQDANGSKKLADFIIWVDELKTLCELKNDSIPEKTNDKNWLSRYFELGLNKNQKAYYNFSIYDHKRLYRNIDFFLKNRFNKDIEWVGDVHK